MTDVAYVYPRRSSRVFMRIRVKVAGKNAIGRRFTETCQTIVINAHGGLVYLNEELQDGAMLSITNPDTLEELECRIVYLGETNDRGQRVGLEFMSPAPHFWGVEFAAPDWIPQAPPPASTPAQTN